MNTARAPKYWIVDNVFDDDDFVENDSNVIVANNITSALYNIAPESSDLKSKPLLPTLKEEY